ncbi:MULTISPECIES: PRD domain-containing protein [Blautia]|jgi:transcriptional antiterminator|uniref:PRD domain-containing protein n=1 Tax=Blautia TaxID=572511 RepID=UPI000E526F15|nr:MULTISPECIES: PRD domain-containing protein [Blautia]RHO17634.1 PRD domain-containing protein [Ruminococcus sp. AM18-44]RHO25484.1 PRD domain-containing protein [Ruminococcus sp. AM18-15]RHQ37177.1 PRD domain-containing protein [Ruminococcus sp. AF25-28AC]RHS08161.1 PRD domain-containing protein [Ruminococcus sp. AF14-5]RHS62055.1 PRD domain-containing protein [Ruminococcus sp. AM45-9BH]RHT08153.1 PRD domain-containing protein [Ruminococcus sp. AM40-10AC]
MSYRITKILNHNSFMGIESKNDQECLIMGKGVAFGKKVGQTVSVTGDARVYSLKELTDRGEAKDIIKSVSPLCLELANEVLDQAEEEFGKVDRSILFTMADHLDFAVRRIQNGEQISNPLTDDIRIMFYKEYKVAGCIRDLLKEKLGIRIDEHEIGYIALHVHAAIVDENVSQAMEIARTVRECICMVEEETGKSIDVMSLSYNRLMNHVRYMVARAIHGEKLKMSLNDYMSVKFPGPYMTAEKICRKMEKSLKLPIPDIEIGYLAMHLERMMDREEE